MDKTLVAKLDTIYQEDQKYRMQIDAPDQVNMRTESEGLGQPSEYTLRFGFEWDVEAYKKGPPQYIEIQKKEYQQD